MADAFSELLPLRIAIYVVVLLAALAWFARAWFAANRLERLGCVLLALSFFGSLIQRLLYPTLPLVNALSNFMNTIGLFMFVLSFRRAAKRAL
jgi:hypothetical protein